ncbi:hypothetical protein ACIP01_22110 [Pseudomonas monteilii]|uniref:hypothetical protein n=1 Tax=Pseudomonas monteilii TaxID=76759 RepID=UPI00381B2CB7
MATLIPESEITNYVLLVIAAAIIIAIQAISFTIKYTPKVYKALGSSFKKINRFLSTLQSQRSESDSRGTIKYWNIEITLTAAGLAQRETIFQALRKEQVPIVARDTNLLVLGSFDEKLHAYEIARKLSTDYGIRSWLTPATQI